MRIKEGPQKAGRERGVSRVQKPVARYLDAAGRAPTSHHNLKSSFHFCSPGEFKPNFQSCFGAVPCGIEYRKSGFPRAVVTATTTDYRD